MSFAKSEKYTDYRDAIFYRRSWFWTISLLLFTPLAVLIGLTGDVYREQDDEVQILPKSYRITISLAFLAIVLVRMVGPFLIGSQE